MSLFKTSRISINQLTKVLSGFYVILFLLFIISVICLFNLFLENSNQTQWLIIVVSLLSLLVAVLTAGIIKFVIFPLMSEQHQTKSKTHNAKESEVTDKLAQSAFLSNMNHELRTPLNAILGYSDMLIEEADDLKPKEFVPELKKINQAGNHLLALINDVLELSLIESGKIEINAVEFSLESFVDEIQTKVQSQMADNSNKLSIKFTHQGDQFDKIFQDKDKLSHALLNLLSNAAKFTNSGEVTLNVDCSTSKEGDWLLLTVSDNGIGIAEDKLNYIFKSFTQADNSSTRHYDGTGLGLTITQRLCQLLGGELSVLSKPGKGSDFSIKIPVTFHWIDK